MSDELSHVLVGDVIGRIAAQVDNPKVNTPFVAALLGFASHALLDKVDHDYTPNLMAWKTDVDEALKDAGYLAVELSGIVAKIIEVSREKDPHTREMRIAGIIGSVLPDVIDGLYSVLKPEAWAEGKLLIPFHRAEPGPRQDMSREATLAKTSAIWFLQGKIRF
jgi:hypothetical protein